MLSKFIAQSYFKINPSPFLKLLVDTALEYYKKGQYPEAALLHQRIFTFKTPIYEIHFHNFVINFIQGKQKNAKESLQILKKTNLKIFQQFFIDIERLIELKKIKWNALQGLSIWNVDSFIMHFYQNRLTSKEKSLLFSSDAELICKISLVPKNNKTWIEKVAWLKFYENRVYSKDAYYLELSKLLAEGSEWELMILYLGLIETRAELTPHIYNPFYVKAMIDLATYYLMMGMPSAPQAIKKIQDYFKKFPEETQAYQWNLNALRKKLESPLK